MRFSQTNSTHSTVQTTTRSIAYIGGECLLGDTTKGIAYWRDVLCFKGRTYSMPTTTQVRGALGRLLAYPDRVIT